MKLLVTIRSKRNQKCTYSTSYTLDAHGNIPQLVVVVDPSQLSIIFCYCRWTRIGVETTVFVLSRNTIHLRGIRIGGNYSDGLVVLPQGDGQILRLARPALTSLLEPPLHEWLQLWGEPFTVCSQSATAIQPYSPSRCKSSRRSTLEK